MINIFTSLPKFLDVLFELRRFNQNEPEIMAARASGDREEERRIIVAGTNKFADILADKLKIKIEVFGEENIPDNGPVYIVSNHQSYADILMLFYAVRKFQIGFIAKSDFRKYKTFTKCIELTRSLYLDRGEPRKAIKTMNEAAELMREGFSLVLFPEGTRSRSSAMNEFKAGGFKAAQKAGVPILPVTVEGGYRLFEEHNSYHPCSAKVLFHPVVPYGGLTRQEQLQANAAIEKTIRNGLAVLK